LLTEDEESDDLEEEDELDLLDEDELDLESEEERLKLTNEFLLLLYFLWL
jgi:hypothetical protein